MVNRQLFVFVLVGVFILSLLLFLVNFSLRKNFSKNQPNIDETVQVSPSPFENFKSDDSNSGRFIDDTKQIKQATKTGAIFDISEEESLKIEQKRKLRKQVPINENYFTLDYNWDTLRFEVGLKGEKSKARSVFLDWVKKNYPALSENDFYFK